MPEIQSDLEDLWRNQQGIIKGFTDKAAQVIAKDPADTDGEAEAAANKAAELSKRLRDTTLRAIKEGHMQLPVAGSRGPMAPQNPPPPPVGPIAGPVMPPALPGGPAVLPMPSLAVPPPPIAPLAVAPPGGPVYPPGYTPPTPQPVVININNGPKGTEVGQEQPVPTGQEAPPEQVDQDLATMLAAKRKAQLPLVEEPYGERDEAGTGFPASDVRSRKEYAAARKRFDELSAQEASPMGGGTTGGKGASEDFGTPPPEENKKLWGPDESFPTTKEDTGALLKQLLSVPQGDLTVGGRFMKGLGVLGFTNEEKVLQEMAKSANPNEPLSSNGTNTLLDLAAKRSSDPDIQRLAVAYKAVIQAEANAVQPPALAFEEPWTRQAALNRIYGEPKGAATPTPPARELGASENEHQEVYPPGYKPEEKKPTNNLSDEEFKKVLNDAQKKTNEQLGIKQSPLDILAGSVLTNPKYQTNGQFDPLKMVQDFSDRAHMDLKKTLAEWDAAHGARPKAGILDVIAAFFAGLSRNPEAMKIANQWHDDAVRWDEMRDKFLESMGARTQQNVALATNFAHQVMAAQTTKEERENLREFQAGQNQLNREQRTYENDQERKRKEAELKDKIEEQRVEEDRKSYEARQNRRARLEAQMATLQASEEWHKLLTTQRQQIINLKEKAYNDPSAYQMLNAALRGVGIATRIIP